MRPRCEIDDEIRRIVEGAHQQAKDILGERRESLKTISEILLKRETIEREEFEALLEGKPEEEVFDDAHVASPHRPKRGPAGRLVARVPEGNPAAAVNQLERPRYEADRIPADAGLTTSEGRSLRGRRGEGGRRSETVGRSCGSEP